MRPYNPPIDVLLVCTANQCRSPMAEVLLARRLADAGVDATVSSAGLLQGGRPATADGVAAMAARGLDLSGHESRTMTADLVGRADLVIGMAREHVREAALLAPDVLAKSFTLKELVQRAEVIGTRRTGDDLPTWLSQLAADRRLEDLLGVAYDERVDVFDPVGRGRRQYEETAVLLDDLLTRLVALAWPRAEVTA